MKVRCLFGHEWRVLPWFKTRNVDDRHDRPEKICMRCWKEERRHYFLIVKSIEGVRGWYSPPFYEGQPPPHGCATWAEYRERMKIARDELIRKAR